MNQNQLAQDALKIVCQMVITVFVFLIQFGFTFLQAGSVRTRNTQSILFLSCMAFINNSVIWWLVGYGIAYGNDYSNFIGTSDFFIMKKQDNYQVYGSWLEQWSFMVTSTTIVSGCAAERMTICGYFIFSLFQSVWIYPLLVHWCWGSGFLQNLGYTDGSGAGVVHMCGGVCGLVLLIYLGPRYKRFDQNFQEDYKPNNISFTILGTWMLLLAMIFLRLGAIPIPLTSRGLIIFPKICVNAGICSSSSGCVVLLLQYCSCKIKGLKVLQFSISELCYGLIAGLVGLTSSVGDYDDGITCIIGIMCGITQWLTSKILFYLQIDDPSQAVSIHFACGTIGLIGITFFHRGKGLIYSGDATLLGTHMIALVVIISWTIANSAVMLTILKKLGLLKVGEKTLKEGLDVQFFGGESQNYDMLTMQLLRNLQRKMEAHAVRNRKLSSRVLDLYQDHNISTDHPNQQGITE